METLKRIHRIKEILGYCGKSVTVTDKRAIEYFKNFFKGRHYTRRDSVLQEEYDLTFSNFDACSFEIGLYLGSNKKDIPTLFFKYPIYDGYSEDDAFYLFNDDEANYEFGSWGDRNAYDEYTGSLEYSDIDDRIWEIIEKTALKKANKQVKKGLEDSRKDVKFYEKRLKDLNELSDRFNKDIG